ncbi:YmfL family putative regulatory protein [Pseudomonas sp. FP1154]|uniref:YmfL family putative regulatory protein n=1 Tax=Pseudomonas sp. FP1154 TaxID=2954077 RepID=UPI002734D451|nr:YmfL family putative regulatory protein [Pseudomonas sp. FP1154]WLG24966.1 YmfL family putative regulatory protein [Pseudomonas sp. FP1154]
MKRSVLANRKDVVSAVIAAYPGGRHYAATDLGMPIKKFDNQAYENAGSRPLSDEHIHRLEQVAGTSYLADYITGMYGGMFVPVAVPGTLDNVELYNRSVRAAAKRGLVDQIIAQALDDGVIEQSEAEVIVSALMKYMSARYAEVLATIQLHGRGFAG